MSLYSGISWQNATDCSMDTMLDDIGPSSSVNLWNLLLISGAISALLIQPVLANLMKRIFVVIDPLSLHCGRVAIPFDDRKATIEPERSRDDKELLAEIKHFERRKNVCPLLFWICALTVISVNIAVATKSI